MATWRSISGASGYLLDVSTSESFNDYVEGYHDLRIGDATGRAVTGLNPGTTYYYRVRPYYVTGVGSYSEAMSQTTVATSGLTIQATFDFSILVNANSGAIQAMIHRAVAIYESLFKDPITIRIYFRYSASRPDGQTLPSGALSQSYSLVYGVPWSTFTNALRADARTPNDDLANASLPHNALAANIGVHSANGRAVRLNMPPAMFANGAVGNGGQYDGIVTLNSQAPFQFTRPVNASNYDAQSATEHEIDEVIGFASHADVSNLRPQDLFSWSSAGHRNIGEGGWRYFSIDGGVNPIVYFNQDQYGDSGDWGNPDESRPCPDPHPHVQNAFGCQGQSSDIAATSPEGVNLDVIGYDLRGAPYAPPGTDFNSDGEPDLLFSNSGTQETWIFYLHDQFGFDSARGPVLPGGWQLVATADFNRNGHPDYLLFNPTTRATVIWSMNNNVHGSGSSGPTLPAGWQVAAVVDFNLDGYPDWVLYNPSTHKTVIWRMRNNVHVAGSYGPTLPAGWTLAGVRDFNNDGRPDYLLYNPGTGRTVIWYLHGSTHASSRSGPTIPGGYDLVGLADFDRNGRPDYLLYNPSTYQVVIWYLNNYRLLGSATLDINLGADWTVVAP
jgi:hypothetical protein